MWARNERKKAKLRRRRTSRVIYDQIKFLTKNIALLYIHTSLEFSFFHQLFSPRKNSFIVSIFSPSFAAVCCFFLFSAKNLGRIKYFSYHSASTLQWGGGEFIERVTNYCQLYFNMLIHAMSGITRKVSEIFLYC